MGQLNFTEDDYDWLTREISDIAAEFYHGRVISTLEGGYNLSALAASVAVHVKALLEALASGVQV